MTHDLIRSYRGGLYSAIQLLGKGGQIVFVAKLLFLLAPRLVDNEQINPFRCLELQL